MTTVGKLFVLLVFSLSLLFLALAIGVYSNHVNWKSASKDQPGHVDRLEEMLRQQAVARDRAYERFNAAYGKLVQAENERDTRNLFYSLKLDMLRTGKARTRPDDPGTVVQTPVFRLARGADGFVPVQMVGNPNDVWQSPRGEPLQSLAYYQQQLAARNKDIMDEKANVEKLQQQLADLTVVMQGTREGKPGLIRLKELQVEARAKAISEQEFLKPELANRFGEAVIVLKREGELRKRLEQQGGTARLDGGR